jgi:hypothetical protein
MTASRQVGTALGACTAVLLTGLFGLAWWLWRQRPGHQPRVVRWRRTRAALTGLGLLVIAVGAGWRLVIAIYPVPECSPSGGAPPATPVTAWVVAQKVATWAETGAGILYAQANDAEVCLSRAENFYVGVKAQNIAGARAVNLGDVVLKPELDIPKENMQMLVEHEAGHRTQWAVGTVLGGPLAFPVVYGISYFFFPGARNPFERLAGLESGGYTPEGSAPVLGPAQLAVLAALGAAIIAAPFVIRHRRAAAGARGQD